MTLRTPGVRALLFLAASIQLAAADVWQAESSPTILTMPFDIGNGFVPPRGPSRVSVPSGDSVYINIPETVPLPIHWTKDGKPLEGQHQRTLTLAAVSAETAGVYRIEGLPWPSVACGIALEVAPAGRTSNLSARFELTPGGLPAITGFVVTGNRPKLLLYRAVGPSLTAFGVANPAKRPVIRIFDARGQQVVPDGRAAVALDFPTWFASLGAFPLTGGEPPGQAFDYNLFNPGAYTAHVYDADGAGGTVLVELYEAAQGPSPQ